MKVNNMTNYRKSNEIKKGIRRKMREGKVWLNCSRFLGYTKDEKGHLVIVEDEARIVKKIFELYLNGLGVRKIKKYLEENKIKTVTGKYEWSTSTIDRILDNEKYDMYFIENNHEPIISRDIFERAKLKKRKILLNNKG